MERAVVSMGVNDPERPRERVMVAERNELADLRTRSPSKCRAIDGMIPRLNPDNPAPAPAHLWRRAPALRARP